MTSASATASTTVTTTTNTNKRARIQEQQQQQQHNDTKSSTNEENDRKLMRPLPLTDEDITHITTLFAGVSEMTITKELDSYDDRNYLVTARIHNDLTSLYVLKIHNGVESKPPSAFVYAQIAMLKHLHKCGFIAPLDVCPPIRYKTMLIRLLGWIEGDTLYQHTLPIIVLEEQDAFPALVRRMGSELARIDKAMSSFSDDTTTAALRNRNLIWDLANFEQVVPYTQYVEPVALRNMIQDIIHEFSTVLHTKLNHLPRQAIQNDANDRNIIVTPSSSFSLIDFGDLCVTWRINQLAIALCYLLVSLYTNNDRPSPAYWRKCFTQMFCGYHATNPLTHMEIQALPLLVQARLCTSICLGSYSYAMSQPKNPYLLIHAKPAVLALESLHEIGTEELIKVFVLV